MILVFFFFFLRFLDFNFAGENIINIIVNVSYIIYKIIIVLQFLQ